MSAFSEYLKQLPLDTAATHFIECLIHGNKDNDAWHLMELTYGNDWSCKPSELRKLVKNLILGLKKTKKKLKLLD